MSVGRERFLADASRILASSLDLQETLRSVAELVVPYLADWCVVDLVEEGQVRRRAVAQCDRDEALEADMYRYAPDPQQPHGVARVIATGRSEMVAHWSEGCSATAARGPGHLTFLRRLGISSYLCVPLVAHAKVHGTLMLLTTRSRRHYEQLDLALAEDLACRAGMAVENARLYQRVEDANRSMDDFLATVSHELRTPLAAMNLWCDLLRFKRDDPAVADRAVDAIHASVRAQSRLIDDLLDVSRIQSGMLDIRREHLALSAVIEGATEMVRPAAESKEIALTTDVEDDTIAVLGDEHRLRQVVVNLLSNAIKFTPECGEVRVVLRRDGEQALIEVTDTGKGIAPEIVPHIFERFVQADPDHSGPTSGLGLGLTIVQRLVGLHGGFVTAASPGRNKGATFTVHLSVAPQASVAPAAPPHDASVMSGGQQLAGVQVMVVEDELDIAEVVTVALESQGARVTAAHSVAEALALLEMSVPDVLLSDIAMPGEDGYSLIRKVRNLPAERGGRLPAAALTAHVRLEDRVRALEAGYQAHIAKPVDLGELTALVVKLAGRAEPVQATSMH